MTITHTQPSAAETWRHYRQDETRTAAQTATQEAWAEAFPEIAHSQHNDNEATQAAANAAANAAADAAAAAYAASLADADKPAAHAVDVWESASQASAETAAESAAWTACIEALQAHTGKAWTDADEHCRQAVRRSWAIGWEDNRDTATGSPLSDPYGDTVTINPDYLLNDEERAALTVIIRNGGENVMADDVSDTTAWSVSESLGTLERLESRGFVRRVESSHDDSIFWALAADF